MDSEPAFDWATLFANAWESVLSGEVSAPHSTEEWAVFFDRGWDSVLDDVPAAVEPQSFVMADDAPIDTSKVVYDFSDVSWNEGAPGVDATYYDGVSFANGTVSYVSPRSAALRREHPAHLRTNGRPAEEQHGPIRFRWRVPLHAEGR
jgi:hypothetical protein